MSYYGGNDTRGGDYTSRRYVSEVRFESLFSNTLCESLIHFSPLFRVDLSHHAVMVDTVVQLADTELEPVATEVVAVAVDMEELVDMRQVVEEEEPMVEALVSEAAVASPVEVSEVVFNRLIFKRPNLLRLRRISTLNTLQSKLAPKQKLKHGEHPSRW